MLHHHLGIETHPVTVDARSRRSETFPGVGMEDVDTGPLQHLERGDMDGLDLVVGSTSSVAGDDLQVVAEFDFPSYRVQILDGPELPCLIAVHDSDGRALGVYERYDLAVRSFPEIESTALAGSFAMMSPPPADR